MAKQLCRELDLSVGTVSGWVKKYRDKKNLSANPKLVTPAELEKRETAYEKRIRELEEEVDILGLCTSSAKTRCDFSVHI